MLYFSTGRTPNQAVSICICSLLGCYDDVNVSYCIASQEEEGEIEFENRYDWIPN